VTTITPIITRVCEISGMCYEDIATPSIKTTMAKTARLAIIYAAYTKGLTFRKIAKTLNIGYGMTGRLCTEAKEQYETNTFFKEAVDYILSNKTEIPA
jgi:hypothetical protein